MQFVVIAYDYKKDGLKRRLSVRDQHIKMGDQMKANGNYIMGVGLLDEKENMIGSIMILDYPSKKELDDWLKIEPYMVNKVWKKVQILRCKVGPSFTNK